jgi:predicted GTPase
LQIAVVGKPNVWKSSVFNALIGTSRVILTEFLGMTRDLVTEVVVGAGTRRGDGPFEAADDRLDE